MPRCAGTALAETAMAVSANRGETTAITAPSSSKPAASSSISGSASPKAARAGHHTDAVESGAKAAAASDVRTANRDSVP